MLIINNIEMSEPKSNGMSITRNKVWSSNTGRTASGNMVGDLICIKYKLEITWAVSDFADAALIDNAVSSAFFPVTFTDIDGSTVTRTFYAGDATYPRYSNFIRGVKYTNISVNLIEQ